METVQSPALYELEDAPFSLSIPVISFTPAKNDSDSNPGEEHSFGKYHNNNNNQCRQFNKNNYQNSVLNIENQVNDNTENEDASLPDRLKELSRCIKWIHTEMKALKEERDSLTQRFHDIESDIREIYMMLPTSPFTSCDSSFLSLDEESCDRLHLSDQFEYEFRARTSSLLLPQRNTLSPSPSRKSNLTSYNRCTLNRPKSLTHLHTSSPA